MPQLLCTCSPSPVDSEHLFYSDVINISVVVLQVGSDGMHVRI